MRSDNSGVALSRRRFLAGLTLTGGAAVLAGCSGSGDPGCGRSQKVLTRSRATNSPVIGGAYTLVDMGSLAYGSLYTPIFEPLPTLINQNGQVVVFRGYTLSSGCGATLYGEPQLWTPNANRRGGTIRSLEPASEPKSMLPFCIADSGETAGMFFATGMYTPYIATALPASGNARPTVRTLADGVPSDSALSEPAVSYLPAAINSRGDILLLSYNRVTYLVQGSTYHRLPILGADLRLIGRMLNDDGVIIGYTERETTTGRVRETAFLYQNGTLTELGVPVGFVRTVAVHRNNAGQIVGSAFTDSGTRRGFLWENGAFTLIGQESFEPTAINDSGVVVGHLGSDLDTRKAAIWKGGTLTELNSQIASGSGWDLRAAWAVNNSEFIVALGVFRGTGSGVILMPA